MTTLELTFPLGGYAAPKKDWPPNVSATGTPGTNNPSIVLPPSGVAFIDAPTATMLMSSSVQRNCSVIGHVYQGASR